MRPVIRRGDLLLVSSRDEYKPGDIIVFHTDYNGDASCLFVE